MITTATVEFLIGGDKDEVFSIKDDIDKSLISTAGEEPDAVCFGFLMNAIDSIIQTVLSGSSFSEISERVNLTVKELTEQGHDISIDKIEEGVHWWGN